MILNKIKTYYFKKSFFEIYTKAKMKKTEHNQFKESLQNLSQILKSPECAALYTEIDKNMVILENLSKNLKQKSILTQKTLLGKFTTLWEKLKRQFESNLENSFLDFDKELKNIDVLILYFKHEQDNLKDLESNNSKFLNDLNNADDQSFFNEKQSLENFLLLNTPLSMKKFKHFLSESLKKADKMVNFELELEKEFSLILNSFEITQEKLSSFSKSSHNFEEILHEIKALSIPIPSTNLDMLFSSKNPINLQKKKEIPTNHIQKTYKEMFSPSGISILKIIHFKENFYITCGWDGRINVTNALGKKTTMNFEAHVLPIRDIIKIQPNIFITTADDCKTKVWNLENEPLLISQIETQNDKMRCMMIRGKLCEGSLIMGGDAGILKMYDLGLFQNEFNLKITDFGITSIAGLEGSDKIIIGSARGEIIFFDVFLKKILKSIDDAHDDWITSFSILKKNAVYEISTGSFDCFVKLWSFNSESNEFSLLKKIKCDGWVLKTIYFKVNVIVAGSGQNLYFIDIEKGSIMKKFDHAHETYVNDFCLSKKDGSLLSVGQDETNNIREWSD